MEPTAGSIPPRELIVILMAPALLKQALRSAADRSLVLIFSRHTHVGERDAGPALGAVVIVMLQSYGGNA